MSDTARKSYYCNCEAMCHGQRREVSRTTFYDHKKHRNPLTQFTPRFQNFLHNVGPPSAGQSHSADVARGRAETSAPSQPSSSNKRPRLSENRFAPPVLQ